MSIKTSFGYSGLVRYQTTGDPSETPPIRFSGINPTDDHWSLSVWVRANSNIPAPVWAIICQNGSELRLQNDGINWQVTARDRTIGLPTMFLHPIVLHRWTLIGITKDGPTAIVYAGTEDPIDTSPWDRPVPIVQVGGNMYHEINDPFFSFVVQIAPNVDLCCVKYWDVTLTKEQLQTQAHRWDDETEGAGAKPIWVTPLRTAGDFGNVASPGPASSGLQYNLIEPSSNIVTAGVFGGWNDPAFMSNTMPCPTWLYPTSGFGHCFVNPGMTPFVPTNYKAPQFFRFSDKGAVPINDLAIQKIRYYGVAYPGANIGDPGTGVPPSDTWGLYKNESGVLISSVGTPTNSFKQTGDAGITIPGDIKATTMYRWEFGAEFTWQPVTPQSPTATGNVQYLLLYVVYIGFPSGVQFISKVDLSGLFVINKPQQARQDIYNNSVALKIPDPTVRTAYIGE